MKRSKKPQPEDPIDFLYETDAEDKAAFGENYCGPAKFKPHDWTTVAKFDAGMEGRPVEIDEFRCPAAFYRVRVPEYNGRRAVVLTSGSGNATRDLCIQLARAFADNMIDTD